MNKVILIGRLARDPELRYTGNNTAVCQTSIAVDRRFKSEGQPTADFIPIVAWRKTAEFINKYFTKGSRIAIVGNIQTRSWEDDNGNKRYATEVIVDEAEFCESKQAPAAATEEAGYYDGLDDSAPARQQTAQTTPETDFFGAELLTDDDVPF